MLRKNPIAVGTLLFAMSVPSLQAQTQKPTVLVPSTKSTHAPALQKRGATVKIKKQPAIKKRVPNKATLPAGIPLRVQIDHRYRMHIGKPIVGHLIDPVYSGDHIVLPANTPIYGTISGLTPVRGSKRGWALANGDFTPLKKSVLHFNSVKLPDGLRLQIDANASERTADLVKLGPPVKKQSRLQKIKSGIHSKLVGFKEGFFAPFRAKNKSEKALQILYGQLPYHPQDIWTGTQFDADLVKPVILPDPKANDLLPLTPPHGHIPPGTIEARLITPLSSKTDKIGKSVDAVLTQPYLSQNHKNVILPTGTNLIGVVTQVKPARMWSRNGTLRFTFRQVKLPQGTMEKVHAQMTAVEGKKGQNVALDREGGAHATADKGKYMDPLVLGYLAGSNAVDTNQNQVDAATISNGFGLPARIISILFVTPAAISGFAYYALGQSLTRRWVLRGHEVVFAKNTRMQLAIADR